MIGRPMERRGDENGLHRAGPAESGGWVVWRASSRGKNFGGTNSSSTLCRRRLRIPVITGARGTLPPRFFSPIDPARCCTSGRKYCFSNGRWRQLPGKAISPRPSRAKDPGVPAKSGRQRLPRMPPKGNRRGVIYTIGLVDWRGAGENLGGHGRWIDSTDARRRENVGERLRRRMLTALEQSERTSKRRILMRGQRMRRWTGIRVEDYQALSSIAHGISARLGQNASLMEFPRGSFLNCVRGRSCSKRVLLYAMHGKGKSMRLFNDGRGFWAALATQSAGDIGA